MDGEAATRISRGRALARERSHDGGASPSPSPSIGHKRKPSRSHKDKDKDKERSKQDNIKDKKHHGKDKPKNKKEKSASTEESIRDQLSFLSSGAAGRDVPGWMNDSSNSTMAAFEADKLRVQQLANNLEQSQQLTNQMVKIHYV